MKTDSKLETQSSQAFGRDFVFLMARLNRERGSYESAAGARNELEAEAEELLRRHAVPSLVAEYVRHVVRLGFEADFDPLDPAQAPRDPVDDDGWTAFAPSAPGPYALCRSAGEAPVEIASFDRRDGRWLVRRWGVSGAVDWSALQREGWKRWRALALTPRT
jgi:hypothetical protein